jgi:hypothetical protein
MKKTIYKLVLFLIIVGFVCSVLPGVVFAEDDSETRKYEVTTLCPYNGTGTDDDVYIQFIGDDKKTAEMLLDNTDINDFEYGIIDNFVVTGKDVGDVRQIYIRHVGEDDLALSYITFENYTYYLPDDEIHENCYYRFNTMYRKNGIRTYDLAIKTLTNFATGTDDNVLVNFIGNNGETGFMLLDWEDFNDFESGSEKHYYLSSKDVGVVNKIEFKLEGYDNWSLEEIQFSGNTYKVYKELENSSCSVDITEDDEIPNSMSAIVSPSVYSVTIVIVFTAVIIAIVVLLIVRKKKLSAGRPE